MSTKLGKQAEQASVEYLVRNSYRILAQNWRTRHCEIDIVASKDRVVYFVEVKYRSKVGQGSGLDYVTLAKQKQMSYAAETFMSRYRLECQYILMVIGVGPSFEVTDCIELTS